MAQAIYVITNFQFNHYTQPLDPRFLKSPRNFIYYLIDQQVPEVLQEKKILHECTLDPLLHEAGREHLGEWSFLLAEEKHQFCEYPFFMISSRFYEKNHWLRRDLGQEWDRLFAYFLDYRFGFLPSYDRPLRWFDLDWKKRLKKKEWHYLFFPWKEPAFELIQELYDVQIPEEYQYVSDLQCHYIGFRDRTAFLDYVGFYRRLIDCFFDDRYQLKEQLEPYVRKTGRFRKEKPFTFLLEIFSHLFFFVRAEKAFALHYDGYYEVDERATRFTKLEDHSPPLFLALEQKLRWCWRWLRTEGWLAPLYARIFSLYKDST